MDSYERKNLIIQLIEELAGEEKETDSNSLFTPEHYHGCDCAQCVFNKKFNFGWNAHRAEILKKVEDKEFLERYENLLN
jgi:hypothetical protein